MIRPARPEDIEAVLSLWNEDGVMASPTDTERAVADLLIDQPDVLLVAEDGHQIVGALIAAWDGWRGNMYRLAVHPDHRRHGLGRALVEEGERRLRARGARRITALVNDDPVARASWLAFGYGRDPHVDRHVKMVDYSDLR